MCVCTGWLQCWIQNTKYYTTSHAKLLPRTHYSRVPSGNFPRSFYSVFRSFHRTSSHHTTIAAVFIYFSRSQPHFYANRSDRIRVDGFSGFPFLRAYDQCYRSYSVQIIYMDVPAAASLVVDKLGNSSTRPSHPVVWPGVWRLLSRPPGIKIEYIFIYRFNMYIMWTQFT